ncbi:MAG: glycerol-3-phosphate acyltransferase [Dehalococcoidia bacterium]|jgi:glycerol-3-phosphate acyltransferase PlsY|nr:glycerol-3-phosphate acyltransferase [Dehalococcoidia bacterium]
MEILGAPLAGILALGIGSYLFGAIPTAYLAVRFRRGVDIRQLGSGNVGGANAIQAIGKGPGLAVMAFDVFVKGGAPVLVADGLLGYGHGAEVIAGSTALIGHNWSIFLRFSGGRGLGTGSGVMFAMAWPIWFIFAGTGLLYWLITRNSPLGWVIALLLQPFIVAAFGLPGEYVVYAAIFAAMSGIKRVASNPGERSVFPRSGDMSRRRLYWNRLIYDRDIKDREAWLRGDAGG